MSVTPDPDVWVIPIDGSSAALPAVGFALWGSAKASSYTSGSYAWTATDRPRRQPLVEWTSQPLWQLELPLALDGSDLGLSVEADLAQVYSWRRPLASVGRAPLLTVVSRAVSRHGVYAWALYDIAEGEEIRDRTGNRLQQPVTLTLLEYPDYQAAPTSSPAATASAQLAAPFNLLPPALQALLAPYADRLSALATQYAPQLAQLQLYLARYGPGLSASQLAALRADLANNLEGFVAQIPQLLAVLPKSASGSGRTAVVHTGDNLETVAARELGDYRLWPGIAALNGIRDPNAVAWGQVLRLP